MSSEVVDDPGITCSVLMHDTINQISTIISIAQFGLISKEMSPEVQADMKRIVATMRQVANNLKRLAEILDEA